MSNNKKWYLGKLKDTEENVFLYDFEWNCDWYWGGGYVGNSNFHTHFNSCFLDVPDSRRHPLGNFYDPWTRVPDYLNNSDIVRLKNGAAVWEDLSFFLDDWQYVGNRWWRIKDLFKQFYTLRDAAEVFQYGGHCTSFGRTDGELSPAMAAALNTQIEKIIIREIRVILDSKNPCE